jgi:hypothetical protein
MCLRPSWRVLSAHKLTAATHQRRLRRRRLAGRPHWRTARQDDPHRLAEFAIHAHVRCARRPNRQRLCRSAVNKEGVRAAAPECRACGSAAKVGSEAKARERVAADALKTHVERSSQSRSYSGLARRARRAATQDAGAQRRQGRKDQACGCARVCSRQAACGLCEHDVHQLQ